MAQSVTPPDLIEESEEPHGADDESQGSSKEITGKSPMQIALGRLRRDKIAMVCAGFVAVFILVAIFAPLIAKAFGVSPETGRPSLYLDFLTGLPKIGPPNHGFTMDHPLGLAPKEATDNLAVLLYGIRTSLLVATTATILSAITGIVLGLVAGYAGGVLDRIISFIIDFFLTIPFLLAALTIAPILGQRFAEKSYYGQIQMYSLVVILWIFGWMGMARLIRGEVLSLREREFVQSAQVIGMPTRRILTKELLPNLAAPIVISISLMLPAYVAAEAGLAYLGIGVTQGQSLGVMINKASAITYVNQYPLYLWAPLTVILVMVVSLNLLGDAIRDALDPKTRR